MLNRVLRMSYCEFCSLRTRVPGFSDCNLRDLHKIDDSCLYNIPSKVRDCLKIIFNNNKFIKKSVLQP